MVATTITFSTSRGVVSWSALERRAVGPPGGIAGGLLGGEPALVAIVREILAGSLPKTVRVAEPNLDYMFTRNRDTAAASAATRSGGRALQPTHVGARPCSASALSWCSPRVIE